VVLAKQQNNEVVTSTISLLMAILTKTTQSQM
jgi:hypothetical protein